MGARRILLLAGYPRGVSEEPVNPIPSADVLAECQGHLRPLEITQHAELSYRRHAEISDVALEALLGPTQRAST